MLALKVAWIFPVTTDSCMIPKFIKLYSGKGKVIILKVKSEGRG